MKTITSKTTLNLGFEFDSKLELVYQGSVKNIYRLKSGVDPKSCFQPIREISSKTSVLFFEFTDDYSIFDWGKMPDTIAGKGSAIAIMSAAFFSALENCGIKTHWLGVSQNQLGKTGVWVEEVNIHRPHLKPGSSVYDYSNLPKQVAQSLIPLEVIFRFQAVEGSSFVQRFSHRGVQVGNKFETPWIEFFTKLERVDRPVEGEALLEVSGLELSKLNELEQKTSQVALWLKKQFDELEFELIDGKLEWALDEHGDLMLVDGIGPDELRLVKKGSTHPLSKEFLRDYYRKTPWYLDLKTAKAEALKKQEIQFKKFCTIDPPSLPPEMLRRTQEIYFGLADRVWSKYKPKNLKGLFKKVAVIGSGGREHALAWKLLQSPWMRELILVPGNDGMFAQLQIEAEAQSKIRCELFGEFHHEGEPHIPASKNSILVKRLPKVHAQELAKQLSALGVDLCVIGPDQDLADGIVDELQTQQSHHVPLLAFGPTQQAAKIESSKSFAKEIMREAQVPTAQHFVAHSLSETQLLLNKMNYPCVLKMDGLALGKGVKIVKTHQEAQGVAQEFFKNSKTVLIEEFLEGREVSWFALCDGEECRLLEPACDYKTLTHDPQSPNTGGMGSISPIFNELGVFPNPEFEERVLNQVFLPVLRELKKRGTPYRGLLYAGLIVKDLKFWVLEFNARFGDPETQCLLPRMKDDLLPWLQASACGSLHQMPKKVLFHPFHAVYTVAAAQGYPETPKTGVRIKNFEKYVAARPVSFFSSAVVQDVTEDPAVWRTSGGRVLGTLGVGDTRAEARRNSLRTLRELSFEGMQARSDVGKESLSKQNSPKVAILASGRGSNAEAIMKAIRKQELPVELVLVISNVQNAPVLEKARSLDFPCEWISSEKEQILKLKSLKVEAILLAGYMKILSPEMIDEFRAPSLGNTKGESRIYNIHPSLLPYYKGLNAYEQAYQAQGTGGVPFEAGVTVHRVEPELDSGPILAQKAFNFKDAKSVQEVEEQGLKIEHELYVQVLKELFKEPL